MDTNVVNYHYKIGTVLHFTSTFHKQPISDRDEIILNCWTSVLFYYRKEYYVNSISYCDMDTPTFKIIQMFGYKELSRMIICFDRNIWGPSGRVRLFFR